MTVYFAWRRRRAEYGGGWLLGIAMCVVIPFGVWLLTKLFAGWTKVYFPYIGELLEDFGAWWAGLWANFMTWVIKWAVQVPFEWAIEHFGELGLGLIDSLLQSATVALDLPEGSLDTYKDYIKGVDKILPVGLMINAVLVVWGLRFSVFAFKAIKWLVPKPFGIGQS